MPYFPQPGVYERTGRGERHWDVFSRLLKDRIIFLGWEIDDLTASYIIGQILFLQLDNKDQDINIYINSPGGSITAGLAIYDTMQYVSNEIATYCLGQATSMAAVLLAAGTKGKRFALPNSRIMLHQPWGASKGTAADITIQAEEILRVRKSLNDILASHTGQPIKIIERDSDRDFFMSAEEAKKYGLVDEILRSSKDPDRQKDSSGAK